MLWFGGELCCCKSQKATRCPISKTRSKLQVIMDWLTSLYTSSHLFLHTLNWKSLRVGEIRSISLSCEVIITWSLGIKQLRKSFQTIRQNNNIQIVHDMLVFKMSFLLKLCRSPANIAVLWSDALFVSSINRERVTRQQWDDLSSWTPAWRCCDVHIHFLRNCQALGS